MLNIKRTYRQISEDQIEVTVTPPAWSGTKGSSVILTLDQFRRMKDLWLNGHKMIQDALPDLSASDREILMTGIGPEEWDEMFKERD